MHKGLRGPGRARGRGWLARITREHIKWAPAGSVRSKLAK